MLSWFNTKAGETYEGAIRVCEDCAHEFNEGIEVTLTSCDDYPYCSVCGKYGSMYEYFPVFEVRLRIVHEDECNCLVEHGRILHFNGGNYHYSTAVVEKVIGRLI